MWIFLPDAFFSIVEHRDDPSVLLVRSRLDGDIERHFPQADVLELPGADYRFRAKVERELVIATMFWLMRDGIDYPDFKSQVSPGDPDRLAAYYDVWTAMRKAQRGEQLPETKRVLVDRAELEQLRSRVHTLEIENTRLRDKALREAPLMSLLTEVSLLLECDTPAACIDAARWHTKGDRDRDDYSLVAGQYRATLEALAEALEVVNG